MQLLKRLMDLRHNGMIKVITGMRRCGKSYLLFRLFSEALKAEGVSDEHIVMVNLEDRRNKVLRDPDKLLEYIDSKLKMIRCIMFYLMKCNLLVILKMYLIHTYR